MLRPKRQATDAEQFERLSNEELYSLIKERFPAVADAVDEVGSYNRASILALITVLLDNDR